MELLFAISVVLGAFLLGSFLGKAFVALIQRDSYAQAIKDTMATLDRYRKI